MMHGRGYNGINSCFGSYGFMHNGLEMGLMFLMVLVIGVVIILLLKKYKKNYIYNGAVEALKIRFVKGEITEEEYIKMKKLIEK
ncbi:MAG: hypothetical protein ACM3X7_03720 [Solirubrobacterales bacterium]